MGNTIEKVPVLTHTYNGIIYISSERLPNKAIANAEDW